MTPSQAAYAAVAVVDVLRGYPIAQYSGEHIVGTDASSTNHYLYEIPPSEMAKRAYKGPTLLVDPKSKGEPARWIHDDGNTIDRTAFWKWEFHSSSVAMEVLPR